MHSISTKFISTKFFLPMPIVFAAALLAANAANSQALPPALNLAKARVACGAGTPIAAEYLPNGQIKVTCRSPSNSSSTEALRNTGISSGAAGAGAVLTAVIMGVAGGDDGSSTTTSTSTTTTGGDQ
jgi:hypothetical protein